MKFWSRHDSIFQVQAVYSYIQYAHTYAHRLSESELNFYYINYCFCPTEAT